MSHASVGMALFGSVLVTTALGGTIGSGEFAGNGANQHGLKFLPVKRTSPFGRSVGGDNLGVGDRAKICRQQSRLGANDNADIPASFCPTVSIALLSKQAESSFTWGNTSAQPRRFP
jgi:hypothetical protein